jgi:uncharacterized membrane protein (UPF0127 family)
MFWEIFLIVIVVIILISLFFYYAEVLQAPNIQRSLASSVCAGEKCFSVELAKTNAEREKGLMNRASLDKNKGMLFIFDKEGIYPFWMKNTLIPLDMIWADSNGKAVFISQNVQPCKSLICPSVIPTSKAKYVLEINAGICQKIGLKLGDELKINLVK